MRQGCKEGNRRKRPDHRPACPSRPHTRQAGASRQQEPTKSSTHEVSVHRPHCVLVSVVLCSWIIADCCWVRNFSSFECRHWFGQQACAGHWGRRRTPAAQQTAKHHKTSQSIAKPPSTKCVSYKYTFRPPCSTVAL